MKRFFKIILCTLFVAFLWSVFAPYSVDAASVKLNKKNATIYVGNTVRLKLSNSSHVVWKSGDTEIASVNNRGIVTGLKSGVTKITASYRSKKYTAAVKVKSHKLNKTKITLARGGAYQLALPKLSLNTKAAWKSSDQSVVKVNANGYVSARNAGTAVVETAVKNETYQCTVTVVEALSNFDFKFNQTEGDNGEYTSYIDLTLAKGSSWYFWYDKAGGGADNRGIAPGDTYEDVIEAFGEAELVTVSSSDRFENLFQASKYPRTALIYKYRENQIDYCKKFYFDGNGNLVLVVWYR